MTDAARAGYRPARPSRDHGPQRQQDDRDLEGQVRRRALARARWARWNRWLNPTIADALGISCETLQEWWRRWNDPLDRLAPKPLGAPTLQATPAQRTDVSNFLALFGTAVSVATLHDQFPQLARRDLACLLHVARARAHADACATFYRCVTWHGPNRVWAMDHTEPPTPIDGIYRYVLTVRDLASGATLAAHAVEHADAASTIALLDDLRARHGAPLVLKADNGSAFVAAETRDYLRRIGTVLLRSPPYCPQYNGACEAGNGTIKRLAHEIATRHGRPDRWTLDDLEAARLWANRRNVDRHHSRSPEERFADRTPIGSDQRHAFADTVAGAKRKRRADLDVAPGQRIRTMTADALDRQAITDALLGTGVITIRNRPIRPCNPLREVG